MESNFTVGGVKHSEETPAKTYKFNQVYISTKKINQGWWRIKAAQNITFLKLTVTN